MPRTYRNDNIQNYDIFHYAAHHHGEWYSYCYIRVDIRATLYVSGQLQVAAVSLDYKENVR